MKKLSKILSVALSLALCAGLVAPALAVTYDISVGNVYVESDANGVYSYQGKKTDEGISRDKDITVTGTSIYKAAETDEDGNEIAPKVEGYTITVKDGVTDTTITLKDVNIDVSEVDHKGAFSISGGSTDVTVELDGENTLKSGRGAGGLLLVQGASVTIRDENEDGGTLTAQGGWYGTGIGGGKVGDITIEGGDVTARGGTFAPGIGGETFDNITISGGTVTARGSGSAAIGGVRQRNTVGNITITGENTTVMATNTSEGAGIGSGFSGSVGNITITGGSTVTATGGANAAGIGAGSFGSVKTITIEGGTVTATGGGDAAGIGSSRRGSVEVIAITGGNVTATGGGSAAGIGTGGSGTFGAVSITGGDIVARSGSGASAIGSGAGGTGGTIAIQGVNSLIALGDTYFAIDTRSDTAGVEQTILNGRFLEDGSGLSKVSEVEFVIVDAEGNEVKRFTLEPRVASNMYESFAINLPEGGKYYVFCEGDYDNSVVGYGSGGKQVMYVIEENAMLSADLMRFPSFAVNYSFVSGTQGQELPESITAPASETGKKVTLGQLNELITADSTYSDVRAGGGTWHFEGWSEGQPVIDEEGILTDVELVGTWTFTPDPTAPAPGTVEIEDVDVPLAGLFTRADAIGYLWQQAGSPEWELSDFADVPEDHEWAVAIGWAQDMGIAVADADGNFRPDDLVLRSVESLEISPEGELQEFLNRYAAYAGVELDGDKLFVELEGAADDVIMGEEAQEIFDSFFAKLETALAQAA